MKKLVTQNIGHKISCGFFALTLACTAKVLLSGRGNNDGAIGKKALMRLMMVLMVFSFPVEDVFAQGLLGRMKQGVLDVAKETVNEAVDQKMPAPQGGAVDEKQRAPAGNNDLQEAEARRKAQAEEAKAREAEWKENQAKQDAERVAEEAKQKAEAQEEILNELRSGNMTAKNARDRLEQRQLWQEGMEKKLDTIVAERLAELEKNKFPLADTFKTPVNMYKEFESGMSKEWCKAKLEAEDNIGLVNTGSINLKTTEGAVILVFKNPIPEKPSVLTACVVELAPAIRHAQVLEKYKGELPGATVKHEAKQLETPKGNNYLMDGISLDMQFSMTRQTDVLTSASKTVTIESNLLVGKAFLVYHNSNPNRKVVVCESSKDGTVTVSDGLDARQQEAAATVKDQMLGSVQKVTVLIEDNALAKALQDLQKAEQENEKKKEEQKKADALAF